MARATAAAAGARRRQVEELDLRGVSRRGIARSLGCDPRTITRDLRELDVQRVADIELAAERRRGLAAARLLERTCWEVFGGVPKPDTAGRLGALGKILAAQQRVADAVGDLVDVDHEQRLLALEAAQMAPPLALNGAARTGQRGAPGSPYAPD